MARKLESVKPMDGSLYSQNQNALMLVKYLRHWIELTGKLPSIYWNTREPKYSIGIRGLIIKGWGISSLGKWTYEMVDEWIPIVRMLETYKIVEIRPTSFLPAQDQPEIYAIVVPNLENLKNAEAILNARI